MFFCFSVTVSTSNKQFGFSKIRVKQSTPRVSTILEALTKICSCEDCWVFIVSGRSREEMEKSMQGIPFLGLASEEGYFYRLPNKYVECRIVNK